MKKSVTLAAMFFVLQIAGVGYSCAVEQGKSALSQAETNELAAFKSAIKAQYDLKVKAFAEKDANTIVDKFYSRDVISTGEGEEVMVGREAIRPMYEKVVQQSDVEIESVYTRVSGKLGWDWANFKVKPRDPSEKPFTFKIVFLWEKINGKWICTGDMFTVGDMHDAKIAY